MCIYVHIYIYMFIFYIYKCMYMCICIYIRILVMYAFCLPLFHHFASLHTVPSGVLLGRARARMLTYSQQLANRSRYRGVKIAFVMQSF